MGYRCLKGDGVKKGYAGAKRGKLIREHKSKMGHGCKRKWGAGKGERRCWTRTIGTRELMRDGC